MSFEYDGLHMMADVVVKKGDASLVSADLGVSFIEKIVEKIDMTMILPPVAVKFPHAICEMHRVVEGLEEEGLGNSKTALDIKEKLKERKNESYGYSVFAMIAESHISIHTFPELNYFSFDCYSCKSFDVDKVVEVIKESFAAEKIEMQVVDRRIPDVDKV